MMTFLRTDDWGCGSKQDSIVKGVVSAYTELLTICYGRLTVIDTTRESIQLESQYGLPHDIFHQYKNRHHTSSKS